MGNRNGGNRVWCRELLSGFFWGLGFLEFKRDLYVKLLIKAPCSKEKKNVSWILLPNLNFEFVKRSIKA